MHFSAYSFLPPPLHPSSLTFHMPQRILVYVTLSHLHTWSRQQSSTSMKHSRPLSPPFFHSVRRSLFISLRPPPPPPPSCSFSRRVPPLLELPFVPRNLNGENPLTPRAYSPFISTFLEIFFSSLLFLSRNNFSTAIQASYFQVLFILQTRGGINGFSNCFKYFSWIICHKSLISLLFYLTFRVNRVCN